MYFYGFECVFLVIPAMGIFSGTVLIVLQFLYFDKPGIIFYMQVSKEGSSHGT